MYNIFATLEDPQKRLLGPNIFSLKFAGLLLPKNRFLICLRIFQHFNVLYFAITQLMAAYSYYLKNDLELVLTIIKIAMLTWAGFFKILSFMLKQNSWKQILDYVTEADEFERSNRDKKRETIIDEYTTYCRRVTYFYWLMMFITHVAHPVSAVGPQFMQFVVSTEYRQSIYNESVSFPEIFHSWQPFDQQRSPNCWLILLWHYVLCANGAVFLAGYDASVVVLIIFFGGKLDLIRERCKEMFGKTGNIKSEDEFNVTLRELSRMHNELMKYGRLFNSLLSPVMFFYLVTCTMMLCASLYQSTSQTELFQKILVAQFLCYSVAQLFLVCLPSNQVHIKSQNVALGPYESEWWNSKATAHQRRNVLLLCYQLRQELIFTAGPFFNLSLPVFVTILKGSYSYYTLLRE